MSSLSLNSSPPKAVVSVRTGKGGEFRRLGQTPLLLDSNAVSEISKETGPFTFEFSMPGFSSKTAIVADLVTDLSIALELKPEIKAADNSAKVNESIDALFETQRFIRAGRYEEAHRRLDDIEKKTPGLAAGFELRGGLYFLSKRFRESYDAYSQARTLNPDSIEAQKMCKNLEKILGLSVNSTSNRIPAEAGSK